MGSSAGSCLGCDSAPAVSAAVRVWSRRGDTVRSPRNSAAQSPAVNPAPPEKNRASPGSGKFAAPFPTASVWRNLSAGLSTALLRTRRPKKLRLRTDPDLFLPQLQQHRKSPGPNPHHDTLVLARYQHACRTRERSGDYLYGQIPWNRPSHEPQSHPHKCIPVCTLWRSYSIVRKFRRHEVFALFS